MRFIHAVLAPLALSLSFNLACSEDDEATVAQPATVVAAAEATPSLSSLLALVKARPAIAEALLGKDLTVFAPSNEAFAAAKLSGLTDDEITKILQYHVVSVSASSGILASELEAKQAVASLTAEKLYVTKDGTAVTVNGTAKVTTADVSTANGSVVHIIDKVLLPDNRGTIVDAVVKRYDLSSLTSVVVSQSLAETLGAATPQKTVFAPTNEAFGKLTTVPAGEALTAVLTYHVLASKVLSTDITASITAPTVNGKTLTVAPIDGKVKLTDSTTTKATVTEADIVTTNGVIHIIDKVLIPGS
jgi:uncharacterized surface protein with fasciclin (FAS1) repeats